MIPKAHLPTIVTLFLAFAVTSGPAIAQSTPRNPGDYFHTGAQFCPNGTMLAAGQVLHLSSNGSPALFQVFGYQYGGNGHDTFALPDLRGGPLTTCIVASSLFPTERLLGEVFREDGGCPEDTLPADGRLLPISWAGGLHSLYGTRFGGDGRGTFALPNLHLEARRELHCVMIRGQWPQRN
jgi:microcystin-dependent protein